MTRLELAQAAHKILKVGPQTPGTAPTSTTSNTDPDLIDIVDSVDRAWRHIQGLSAHWEWRNSRERLTLASGSNKYNLGLWVELDTSGAQAAWATTNEGDTVYVYTSGLSAQRGSAVVARKFSGDSKVHLLLDSDIIDDIVATDVIATSAPATLIDIDSTARTMFEELRFADVTASPFIEMLRTGGTTVHRVYFDNLGDMRYHQYFDWNLEDETSLTFPSGSPTTYSLDEDGKTLVFNYDLDVNHQIILHVRKPVTELTADASEPDMPRRYHDAIVYKACALWASAEEHTKKRQTYMAEYRSRLRQLRNDQLPRLSLVDDVVS